MAGILCRFHIVGGSNLSCTERSLADCVTLGSLRFLPLFQKPSRYVPSPSRSFRADCSLSLQRDLKLTPQQIGNSNIAALASTLIVRFAIGPFVDRYGPRKTMAGLLIVGSIPSGLAGTVTSAQGLYIIRFFIG
jgi:MFS family permease